MTRKTRWCGNSRLVVPFRLLWLPKPAPCAVLTVIFLKGGFSMLSSTLTLSLAQSISEVILAPALQHAEDVTHIHVLLDTLQKIRSPHVHTHDDFATGYLS